MRHTALERWENEGGTALPIIRVLDSQLRFRVLNPVFDVILETGHTGLVLPDQPHLVEPLGSLRVQIEFYHQAPGF
ncbi:MAG: hypothetical protein ABIX37_02255 [Gammaproteobacteria bacterium]